MKTPPTTFPSVAAASHAKYAPGRVVPLRTEERISPLDAIAPTALGNTALLAANLLFEMLCVLPGVKYRA